MMSLTITEKILARSSGETRVYPGQIIASRVDLVLGNDITAPVAIRELEKYGLSVWDPSRVVLVPDHFTPNKDVASAEQAKIVRDFARRHGIKNYFEVGRMGIEHCLLPEQGFIAPGEVIVGADSHTCTYGALGAFATGVGSTDMAAAMASGEIWFRVPESMKFIYYGKLPRWVGGKDLILKTIADIGVEGASYRAMEFTGEAIRELPVDDRFTMCNMAVEAGAKNGIINPDEKTLEYVRGRVSRPFEVLTSDPDASYVEVREYDVSRLEPQVAFPYSPANVRPLSQVGKVLIDQVVIGSCTNGRLTDLRIAAGILNGRRVHPEVRLIVIPGTQQIYLQALREGIIELFVEAGAVVSTPTCGPCLGGHMGILARGERAVATTNRNFVGRMGHVESEVYLASPAVAAASAILGRIAGPEEVTPK